MDAKLPLPLDKHEITAIVVPGAVIAFAMLAAWPNLTTILPDDSAPIGAFSLLALATFVAGHLLQTIASILHSIVWKTVGGMPTEWVVAGKGRLLAPDQFYRLARAIERQAGRPMQSYRKDRKTWYAVTREIYSLVAATGRTGRIDTFNRTYCLMRGIAIAFAIDTAILAFRMPDSWYAEAALGLGIISTMRAVQFAKSYARELFIEYLHTADTSAPTTAQARRPKLHALVGTERPDTAIKY